MGAATEALLPKLTPQMLDISNHIQAETGTPASDDPLDSVLDLVSQLLAEDQEATTASMPLKETDTNIAKVNTFTNLAIDYTATFDPLVLDHPRFKAKHNYKKLNRCGFAKKAKL